MPSTITVNPLTSPLPRDDLARFLPTPRAVRAFEGIQTDVSVTLPEAIGQIIDLTNALLAAPYVTWTDTPVLEDDRSLSVTSTLKISNTGAQLILGLAETGFAPGLYGSATQTIGVQVDLYGRVTGVEAHALVSDNVAEGTTNLYFTLERARSALSQGEGIAYTASSGVIALDTASTRNVDHSAVSITAGNGLSGGGDITQSRELSINTSVVATLTGTQTLTNKTLDQLRTGQTPVPSTNPVTHKVPVVLNGVTYYLLLSNV